MFNRYKKRFDHIEGLVGGQQFFLDNVLHEIKRIESKLDQMLDNLDKQKLLVENYHQIVQQIALHQPYLSDIIRNANQSITKPKLTKHQEMAQKTYNDWNSPITPKKKPTRKPKKVKV
jgi:hypothetical protein